MRLRFTTACGRIGEAFTKPRPSIIGFGYMNTNERKTMHRAIGVLLFVTMTLPGVIAQVPASRSEVSKTEEDKRAEEDVRRLNVEEGQAFLNEDPQTLDHLWSDDMVVTNPLNKFVTKQQVLGMVASGFLVIASFDRKSSTSAFMATP